MDDGRTDGQMDGGMNGRMDVVFVHDAQRAGLLISHSSCAGSAVHVSG